jgi:hypothetical protein
MTRYEWQCHHFQDRTRPFLYHKGGSLIHLCKECKKRVDWELYDNQAVTVERRQP